MSSEASVGPKPGTGRPQYVHSVYAARFSLATCSRQDTNRGQRRHSLTAASRSSIVTGMTSDGSETADSERPEPTDDLVTTRHTLRTATGELAYTATAGRIVLRREEHTDGVFDGHKAKAEVFVVAYTADREPGADPAERPLTVG